jgi:hypothetical protein
MDAACSTHEEKVDVYRILVGKLEVERPIGRNRLNANVSMTACYYHTDILYSLVPLIKTTCFSLHTYVPNNTASYNRRQ